MRSTKQENSKWFTFTKGPICVQRNWILENIRQEMLGKNRSQGYGVQTELNTSFALISQLAIRRQLCVCFGLESADKPDVYFPILQILCMCELVKPPITKLKL